MAYDLTAALDGTLRILGTKQYIYNAAKTRWDRVLPKLLAADITVDYDGKETGNSYIANQYVTGTVTWNQPVTSFGPSNITFTFGSGTIFNNTVAQDLADPKKYTFLFQYSGAVGQFAIPASSVTSSQDNTVNPLTIYSPAIPGVYKPYPVITIVPKTGTSVSVYSIADSFTPGVTRYFSTNLGSATTSSVRLKVAFQNFTNVATTSYTTGDIDRTKIVGTPTLSVNGIYTTDSGTTTAVATTSTRFTDLYYSTGSTINTPILTYISIAASAYSDNGISNDASPRVYFANLPSSSVGMTASTYNVNFASSNAQIGGIQIAFDHYVALLQSMPSLSGITRVSGTGTGSLSNLRRLTSNFPGNTLYADYTLAATPEDYTETFRVPASWATFNGTTNVIKDPTSAGNAFTTRTNSSFVDIPITVVRSALTVSSTYPTNGSTGVPDNSIGVLFNRVITSVVGKYYRIRTGDSNGTIVVNAQVPTASGTVYGVSFTYALMAGSTNYYIEFDAGSYVDAYGNASPTIAFSFQTAAVQPSDIVFQNIVGTTSWIVPPFVTSISAVGIGSGENGSNGPYYYSGGCCGYFTYYYGGGTGGRGGGLSYRNNIPVTPGETLTVYTSGDVNIKRGTTLLLSARSGISGGAGGGSTDGVSHDGGGAGGASNNGVQSVTYINRGGGGGGGAGGYNGSGGSGGGGSNAPANGISGTGGAGGGGSSGASIQYGGNGGQVGLYGVGSTGSGGSTQATGSYGGDGGNGSSGASNQYGGGGGGGFSDGSSFQAGRAGGKHAVRILWGTGRSFPSTNVSSQSS